MWLDPNSISFDLNSVFSRQTSEKVACMPGLDYMYLLECFLSSTFASIISVFPKKFQKLLCAPPPPSPYLYEDLQGSTAKKNSFCFSLTFIHSITWWCCKLQRIIFFIYFVVFISIMCCKWRLCHNN